MSSTVPYGVCDMLVDRFHCDPKLQKYTTQTQTSSSFTEEAPLWFITSNIFEVVKDL